MRLWTLAAVALYIVTNSNADGSDHGHLTYDPGEKYSKPAINRISVDDPQDTEQRGNVIFEEGNSNPTFKFEDDTKEDGVFVETDEVGHISNSVFKFEDSIDKNSVKNIKFEENNLIDNDNDPYIDVKNKDSDRDSVGQPIVFENQNNNQETIRQQNRPSKRKPRLRTQKDNTKYTPANSLHPSDAGRGYPTYNGVRYPGHQNLGNPSTGYPGYPLPAHPTSSHTYPHYPNPYPGMVYPPVYPGYSPHHVPQNPLINQGYGLYPFPGYLRPGQSPLYPGQGSQNVDSKYPNPGLEGATNAGATQNGKPGLPYPGSLHPYYQGYPVPGYAQGYPGLQYPLHGYYAPAYSGSPGSNGYTGSRHPKSLTERAVSAVAEALTSIALYDDQQCVPRLLCEMASGSAVPSSPLLKYAAGLQPLLTLLQAYNGLSSSPLYVFARAAVLGMTAKGNPSNCYQAYPQCPRNPEQLVNYLNNHNGGFFRFFGQPEGSQQNLEQFYSYLSGSQQNQNNRYPGPYSYGLLNPNKPSNYQNYGAKNYGYQNSFKNANNITYGIESRIQNKPAINALDDENDENSNDEDNDSRWLFPDEVRTKTESDRNRLNERENKTKKEAQRPQRASKTLKFPDDISDDSEDQRDNFRKETNVLFPSENNLYSGVNSNLQFNYKYQTAAPFNSEDYVFDHKHNFYVKRPKAVRNDDFVYIVRGNGDPYHPEVVKLKPGQRVQ